ncbi:MAG: TetR/AcrR family transcriptional regulator [Rhodospirillales bacterium]|nr:TetR/AcrR family transcriptional regulator [Rhodospirillales bacterium]
MSLEVEMTPGEAPPAWRERRRRRILAAAAKLFGQRPYLGVQMDDIAVTAGMGKATLYRYFPSKEDLYLEVFDRALVRLTRTIASRLAAGRAPESIVTAIIEAIVQTFSVHIGTLRTLVGDDAGLADRMRHVFRGHRRNIHALLTEALATGMAKGALRDLDLQVTPGLLIGMCWGGVMGNPNVAPPVLAEAAGKIFLRGVAATRPARAGERRRGRKTNGAGGSPYKQTRKEISLSRHDIS